MSVIRDILWNDHVDNSLHHMSTMLLIQFDDYNESTSSKVNDVNVISMIFQINQWKNDDMICSRTQFSLISIFAISIHKNQRLTLSLMMLNFRRSDDCSKQNYVALSRVKSIEHVAFESKFFYNHFSKKISKIVMRRIQNARTRQKLEVQTNVLNVLESINSSQKLECISSQWSKFIIIEDIIVQNTNVASFVQCSSIRERCLHLSLTEAIRTYLVEQINVLIDVFVDALRLFYWRLKENDAIVNVLSRYSLFHCQNDQWIHVYINFRLEMQFDVNAIILISLLNDQWIYSFVIVDVLSQLIVFSEELQLLSLDLTQMICQRID
jgi:hypothetical protein